MDTTMLKTTQKFGDHCLLCKKTINKKWGGCAAGWSGVCGASYGQVFVGNVSKGDQTTGASPGV